ncbi:hypothetical protein [Neisseria yangbaofengii]|uniref:hypothetical protein n=1 Tax=Neisseria yangbaofengii TaxID=2709396 RepID=UPI0013EBDE10|nr:hypothetical protein [Neisseria yangbaofengii]
MNLILEAILSFFFSKYNFSEKKYINAVAKGIILGFFIFLLILSNIIIDPESELIFLRLFYPFLVSIAGGVIITSLLYIIDYIFNDNI